MLGYAKIIGTLFVIKKRDFCNGSFTRELFWRRQHGIATKCITYGDQTYSLNMFGHTLITARHFVLARQTQRGYRRCIEMVSWNCTDTDRTGVKTAEWRDLDGQGLAWRKGEGAETPRIAYCNAIQRTPLWEADCRSAGQGSYEHWMKLKVLLPCLLEQNTRLQASNF